MARLLPATSNLVIHNVGEPIPGAPFAFTALGDSGYGSNFEGNLNLAKTLAVPLVIHLGDMTYSSSISNIDNFANDVKSRLGTTFPFMLSAGNHEGNGGVRDGYLRDFVARLPPRLTLDPIAQANPTKYYAVRYYFDFPQPNPYVRFIVVTPGEGGRWGVEGSYSTNSESWTWMRDAIRGGRALGYPWVIVCDHKNFISAGGKSDEIGETFMNLVLNEKVDLLLQGHEHNYQRSKSLGPPAVSDQLSIVEEGPNTFTKGRGTVLMINGLGGTTSTDPFNTGDNQAKYFAAYLGNNGQAKPAGSFSYGSGYFRVTPTRIDGGFRPITVGRYTEDYSIS